MRKKIKFGLNARFDGLCIDFGNISMNKKKESLCGDYYKIVENDKDHVFVLSDGLGSGVKANILATLTATMLSKMISQNIPLETAVTAVAKTLPICSVRNLAYATFTVADIVDNVLHLSQFDNPDAIVIRDGKIFDYPVTEVKVEDKIIHQSSFKLQEEDMIIMMSDGVTNAGMGKTTDGGWGREDVMKYCLSRYRKGMSAREMAVDVAAASVDLNLDETDDDITVVVWRVQKYQVVNLMIGPPKYERDDEDYMRTFFESEGLHVICGGTTAQTAARYLNKTVVPIQDSGINNVPGRSSLEGVDLVTEGYLTLKRLAESYEQILEDPLAYNKIRRQKDAAAILGNFLFEKASEIRVFFGGAENKGNEIFGINEQKKEELVRTLVEYLRDVGKDVIISQWAT